VEKLALITLAAFNGKRNVTVWRPSVCPSVCPVFSNLNKARGAYSTWLTSGQNGTRPTYISVRSITMLTRSKEQKTTEILTLLSCIMSI